MPIKRLKLFEVPRRFFPAPGRGEHTAVNQSRAHQPVSGQRLFQNTDFPYFEKTAGKQKSEFPIFEFGR
jgi:hypothetical protein